jgi:hypothetical protein
LVAVRTAAWNLGASGIPLADPDRGEPHDRALRDAARSAAYLWTDRRPPGARQLRVRADRRPFRTAVGVLSLAVGVLTLDIDTALTGTGPIG